MKEQQMRLTPERHAQLDEIAGRYPHIITTLFTTAILIAEDFERAKARKIPLSTPAQHMKLIDGYMNGVQMFLHEDVTPIEVGLYVQAGISYIQQVHGRERAAQR